MIDKLRKIISEKGVFKKAEKKTISDYVDIKISEGGIKTDPSRLIRSLEDLERRYPDGISREKMLEELGIEDKGEGENIRYEKMLSISKPHFFGMYSRSENGLNAIGWSEENVAIVMVDSVAVTTQPFCPHIGSISDDGRAALFVSMDEKPMLLCGDARDPIPSWQIMEVPSSIRDMIFIGESLALSVVVPTDKKRSRDEFWLISQDGSMRKIQLMIGRIFGIIRTDDRSEIEIIDGFDISFRYSFPNMRLLERRKLADAVRAFQQKYNPKAVALRKRKGKK